MMIDIVKLKQQRAELDKLIAEAEELEKKINAFTSTQPSGDKVSYAQAAHNLAQGKTPIRVKELIELMASHNIAVNGKDPSVTLFSSLKRSPLWRRNKDGSWQALPAKQ